MSIVKEIDKLSGTTTRSHNITDALKKLGAGPSKNIADAISRIEVGGGGNIVYGSFTTQGEKGVQNIDVPYSGDGYPKEVLIYPADSYGLAAKSHSALSDVTGKNGIISWLGFKNAPNDAPAYGQSNSGIKNEMTVTVAIKDYYDDSTSERFQYSESYYPFEYAEASEPQDRGSYEPYLDRVVGLTQTRMSIFVRGADAGFFQNTDYVYRIIYSE